MLSRIYLSLCGFWNWLFGYESKSEVECVKLNQQFKRKRITMVNPCDITPPKIKPIHRARKKLKTVLLEWNGCDIEKVDWKTQHYL